MDRIKSSSSRHLRHLLSFLPLLLLGMTALAIGARAESESGWLGISVQNIGKGMAEALNLSTEGGVLISEVAGGGPAQKAGLQQRDVITRIDSRDISSADDLVSYVSGKAPGDLVSVRVIREGAPRVFEIRLGASPSSSSSREQTPGIGDFRDKRDGEGEQGNETGRRFVPERQQAGWRLGVRVIPLDRDLAPYFHAEPDRGVLVIGVVPGSPGAAAGIRSGDVIQEVDGVEISDVGKLQDQVGGLNRGDTFSIDVLRRGRIARLHGTVTEEWTNRTPGNIRAPESNSSEYGWNRQQEMMWGHNQLQKLEREIQELQRKIETLTQRIERMRQDRNR